MGSREHPLYRTPNSSLRRFAKYIEDSADAIIREMLWLDVKSEPEYVLANKEAARALTGMALEIRELITFKEHEREKADE